MAGKGPWDNEVQQADFKDENDKKQFRFANVALATLRDYSNLYTVRIECGMCS
jgi:hypothetical protein